MRYAQYTNLIKQYKKESHGWKIAQEVGESPLWYTTHGMYAGVLLYCLCIMFMFTFLFINREYK